MKRYRGGPPPSYYPTGPQLTYLRRLCDEAFVKGFPAHCDRHHLSGLTRAEVSGLIDRLKSAKANGWQREAVAS